jgi:hypothetical protein
MNTFTVPNFEPKKRFEYNTGSTGLKALSVLRVGAYRLRGYKKLRG